HASEDGEDGHASCDQNRTTPSLSGPGPRLGPIDLVEAPDDPGGAGGVVVLEGQIVIDFDVAGLVLTLEVAERRQQEVALVLEGRSTVNGLGHWSPRACSTRARSSSDAW